MPIYEYDCPKCGKWEVIQSGYGSPPHKKCPQCGAPSNRIISAPSMILIGAPLGDRFFQKKYLNPHKSQADAMKNIEKQGRLHEVKPWAQKILKEHIKEGLARSE